MVLLITLLVTIICVTLLYSYSQRITLATSALYIAVQDYLHHIQVSLNGIGPKYIRDILELNNSHHKSVDDSKAIVAHYEQHVFACAATFLWSLLP